MAYISKYNEWLKRKFYAAMIEKKMTIADIARKQRTSPQCVNTQMCRAYTIPLDKLHSLCKVLDLDPVELITNLYKYIDNNEQHQESKH